jgi:hypothetical protein
MTKSPLLTFCMRKQRKERIVIEVWRRMNLVKVKWGNVLISSKQSFVERDQHGIDCKVDPKSVVSLKLWGVDVVSRQTLVWASALGLENRAPSLGSSGPQRELSFSLPPSPIPLQTVKLLVI